MEEQLRVSGESQSAIMLLGLRSQKNSTSVVNMHVRLKFYLDNRSEVIMGLKLLISSKTNGEGIIPSAFHRDDIGNIDLIYGNECIGLKHIIKERIGRG